jgi:SAM-dependent methyltransferase
MPERESDFEPVVRYRRSLTGRVSDCLGFPLRALFMGPVGHFGLTSMRDERMGRAAQFCRGRVLDIGCGPGNLFIKNFIGTDRGVGIDVYPYDGVETVVKSATRLPFEDATFDTVSLVAVGGHIPKPLRKKEFAEFARVLKPGGRLVMTEGEPISQFLAHQWNHFYLLIQGKIDMDHERGMDDDEEYCMRKPELLSYLNTPPLRHVITHSFQWHLNAVYVAEKANEGASAS